MFSSGDGRVIRTLISSKIATWLSMIHQAGELYTAPIGLGIPERVRVAQVIPGKCKFLPDRHITKIAGSRSRPVPSRGR